MKSMSVDLLTREVSSCDTSAVSIPLSNTISTLRGGNYFTSAFSVPSKEGPVLFVSDWHYDRLVHCHQQLFSRLSFPISRAEFNQYITQVFDMNPVSVNEPLQILIIAVAGSSTAQGMGAHSFNNGLMGDLSTMLFVAQPMQVKPKWSFETGINVLTQVHQRPYATAKPTSYMGGLAGQWHMVARNTYQLLSHYYSQPLLVPFQQLSDTDQIRLAGIAREIIADNISFLEAFQGWGTTDYDQLAQQWVQDTNRPVASTLESAHITELYHETIFTSPQGGLLEGATFSLLGLMSDMTWRFIPLHSSEGVVLESTTIRFIKQSLKTTSMDYVNKPILLEDLESMSALFAISSTRLKWENGCIDLQPIRQVNDTMVGDVASIASIPAYSTLTHALSKWMDGYCGAVV